MVLTGVREDQIEKCLAELSLDEIDVLVKYVYKGLGMPRNNGPLFKWHAKVGETEVSRRRTNHFWKIFSRGNMTIRHWSYIPGTDMVVKGRNFRVALSDVQRWSVSLCHCCRLVLYRSSCQPFFPQGCAVVPGARCPWGDVAQHGFAYPLITHAFPNHVDCPTCACTFRGVTSISRVLLLPYLPVGRRVHHPSVFGFLHREQRLHHIVHPPLLASLPPLMCLCCRCCVCVCVCPPPVRAGRRSSRRAEPDASCARSSPGRRCRL